MIRWCAYCQKHLGEAPPFERFEISHGICSACLRAKVPIDEEAMQRLQPVVAFYRKMTKAFRHSEPPSNLLEEGLQLGLEPWDLLVGILQPALRDMGERWAQATATVADEHLLTASCAEILRLMKARLLEGKALDESPTHEVLLVNAERNSHSLGNQMVEFFLATHGVAALAIHRGLTTAEVMAIIRTVRPRKVGISCALPDQLDSAEQTAQAIGSLPEGDRPAVFVGGFALRGLQDNPKAWPFTVCRAPADLLYGTVQHGSSLETDPCPT